MLASMTKRVYEQNRLAVDEICEAWVKDYEVESCTHYWAPGANKTRNRNYHIPGKVCFCIDGVVEGEIIYCPDCLTEGREDCIFESIAGNIYDRDDCPNCGR